MKGLLGPLLAFSKAVDWINAQVAVIANWLVLFACLISAGNAARRARLFHPIHRT